MTSSRRPIQLSLATLLLLLMAFAVGFAWVQSQLRLSTLRTSIASMQSLARELDTSDKRKIAAITKLPTRFGEHICEVFVPSQDSDASPHRLCLALEGIVGNRHPQVEFPSPIESVPLFPGRHMIEIVDRKANAKDPASSFVVEIKIDGGASMRFERPASWHPSGAWSSSGSITTSKSFHADERVELHRRRFNAKAGTGSSSQPDQTPANGILLWIDQASQSER